MPTPSTQRTGWVLLFSAIVIGLVASASLSFFFGISFIAPLVVFAILAAFVGLNWLINAAWDWWRSK